MSSNKQKHLEFIQQTIARMAHNSFLIKAWAISVTSGLILLCLKNDFILEGHVFIIIVPVMVILCYYDAYYLALEKYFRAVYNDVRVKSDDKIDFAMGNPKITFIEVTKHCFSPAMLIYLVIFSLLILIA